jgi:hypothetical protein
LSITAVAVKTPSSASKSVVSVLGEDIVSSSYVACGDVLFAAVHGRRPGRPVLDRSPRGGCLRSGSLSRGPLPRTGPRGAAVRSAGGPVRRAPHE